ncbi:MAG TPA: hypothetical protein VLC98_02075 [Phnomibacter sp.]|nr:hypothetical protein [Phnomibacter sp.]
MDSIQSLIQKLAAASRGGEDNMALLQMVEEIKTAILDSSSIVSPKANEDSLVSVQMPNGFKTHSATAVSKGTTLVAPRPPVCITSEVEEVVEEEIVTENNIAEVAPAPVNITIEQVEIQEEVEKVVELPVPPPPVMASVEAKLPAMETEKGLPTDPDFWRQISSPWMPKPKEEESHELAITDEMLQEAIDLENLAKKPEPMVETEETEPEKIEVKVEVKPVEQVPKTPQDLNEKLAQRSKVLNEMFTEQAPVLAETLAGPRISDLKKAISINEKYQFIESLFRGDEQMFERSIKTLNNFAIYQEAQYWMQRELLIKLGWNEENELVQRFYGLISRRFS